MSRWEDQVARLRSTARLTAETPIHYAKGNQRQCKAYRDLLTEFRTDETYGVQVQEDMVRYVVDFAHDRPGTYDREPDHFEWVAIMDPVFHCRKMNMNTLVNYFDNLANQTLEYSSTSILVVSNLRFVCGFYPLTPGELSDLPPRTPLPENRLIVIIIYPDGSTAKAPAHEYFRYLVEGELGLSAQSVDDRFRGFPLSRSLLREPIKDAQSAAALSTVLLQDVVFTLWVAVREEVFGEILGEIRDRGVENVTPFEPFAPEVELSSEGEEEIESHHGSTAAWTPVSDRGSDYGMTPTRPFDGDEEEEYDHGNTPASSLASSASGSSRGSLSSRASGSSRGSASSPSFSSWAPIPALSVQPPSPAFSVQPPSPSVSIRPSSPAESVRSYIDGTPPSTPVIRDLWRPRTPVDPEPMRTGNPLIESSSNSDESYSPEEAMPVVIPPYRFGNLLPTRQQRTEDGEFERRRRERETRGIHFNRPPRQERPHSRSRSRSRVPQGRQSPQGGRLRKKTKNHKNKRPRKTRKRFI